MIMSASAGRSGVVRWPRRNSEGSVCQNEAVESEGGRLAMSPGYVISTRVDEFYFRCWSSASKICGVHLSSNTLHFA